MRYRWTLTNLSNLDTEVLSKDPIGWDDGVYTIKRSEEYKGAFHEYSVPLKFHCKGGGKSFIDTVYTNEDIDGRIDVLVEFDCDNSGTYETLFNGIINLASYQTDGEYTTVNIEKSDLLTKIFSRDEISVDLETTTSIGGATITAPQTTTLPMSGMEIPQLSSWQWGSDSDHNASFDFTYGHGQVGWFLPNSPANSAEYEETNPLSELGMWDEDYSGASFQYMTSDFDWLQPAIKMLQSGINYPVTVTYNVDIHGTCNIQKNLAGYYGELNYARFNMYIGKPGEVPTLTTLFEESGSLTFPYSFDFDFTETGTFQLNAGDHVWFAWYFDTTITAAPITISVGFGYDNSYINLSGITTASATETKAIMVHEAFNQVIDAIADSDNNFASDFYGRTDSDKVTYANDGCGSLIAITNGLNIREHPNRPVHASFKDLFQSMDCQHNIGMGVVSGKIRVEPLEYWYSDTKLITLENVQKFSTKNDNSKYINKIDIGYEKWESEYRNGLNDPNAKHEYSTEIASVKNSISKLCKFMASPYSIEFTRRKNISMFYFEDWRYDNTNFIIACVRDIYGGILPELYGHSFSNHVNIDSVATVYNLRLTPKRMLLNHLNSITAGLQNINGSISFVKGDGNYLMAIAKDLIAYVEQCPEDYSGVQLAENGNIAWNDTNARNITPIWLPETYSFEYPLTFAEFATIKANPYGYVEFYKDSDDVKQGYIMDMRYTMKTGLTKFELLKRNQ